MSSEHNLSPLIPQMKAWRRAIHHKPELAFEENQTSDLIATELQRAGVETHRGLGGTGIVGVIRGSEPGRAIGLRADIDALPLQDESGCTYASQYPGRSHACGHDGHTAVLLGVAHYLARYPPRGGKVHLIFQPAEETARGARRMIEEGLFERFPCDELYAFHNMPLLAKGTAAVRRGPTLTGYKAWEVSIAGLGGHGAAPHKAVDPLQAAARLAVEISSFISRYVDPMEAALMTVTMLQAGASHNIIPATATLSGTLRALRSDLQEMLYDRLCQACSAFATMTGCQIDCRTLTSSPPCVNASEPATAAAEACAKVLDAANVSTDFKPFPFTDDFAYMLEQCPGAFLFLGQAGPMCHHPAYDFDDELLPVAAAIFLEIIASRTVAR
jgi:hippurate hydrolase